MEQLPEPAFSSTTLGRLTSFAGKTFKQLQENELVKKHWKAAATITLIAGVVTITCSRYQNLLGSSSANNMLLLDPNPIEYMAQLLSGAPKQNVSNKIFYANPITPESLKKHTYENLTPLDVSDGSQDFISSLASSTPLLFTFIGASTLAIAKFAYSVIQISNYLAENQASPVISKTRSNQRKKTPEDTIQLISEEINFEYYRELIDHLKQFTEELKIVANNPEGLDVQTRKQNLYSMFAGTKRSLETYNENHGISKPLNTLLKINFDPSFLASIANLKEDTLKTQCDTAHRRLTEALTPIELDAIEEELDGSAKELKDLLKTLEQLEGITEPYKNEDTVPDNACIEKTQTILRKVYSNLKNHPNISPEKLKSASVKKPNSRARQDIFNSLQGSIFSLMTFISIENLLINLEDFIKFQEEIENAKNADAEIDLDDQSPLNVKILAQYSQSDLESLKTKLKKLAPCACMLAENIPEMIENSMQTRDENLTLSAALGLLNRSYLELLELLNPTGSPYKGLLSFYRKGFLNRIEQILDLAVPYLFINWDIQIEDLNTYAQKPALSGKFAEEELFNRLKATISTLEELSNRSKLSSEGTEERKNAIQKHFIDLEHVPEENTREYAEVVIKHIKHIFFLVSTVQVQETIVKKIEDLINNLNIIKIDFKKQLREFEENVIEEREFKNCSTDAIPVIDENYFLKTKNDLSIKAQELKKILPIFALNKLYENLNILKLNILIDQTIEAFQKPPHFETFQKILKDFQRRFKDFEKKRKDFQNPSDVKKSRRMNRSLKRERSKTETRYEFMSQKTQSLIINIADTIRDLEKALRLEQIPNPLIAIKETCGEEFIIQLDAEDLEGIINDLAYEFGKFQTLIDIDQELNHIVESTLTYPSARQLFDAIKKLEALYLNEDMLPPFGKREFLHELTKTLGNIATYAKYTLFVSEDYVENIISPILLTGSELEISTSLLKAMKELMFMIRHAHPIDERIIIQRKESIHALEQHLALLSASDKNYPLVIETINKIRSTLYIKRIQNMTKEVIDLLDK